MYSVSIAERDTAQHSSFTHSLLYGHTPTLMQTFTHTYIHGVSIAERDTEQHSSLHSLSLSDTNSHPRTHTHTHVHT